MAFPGMQISKMLKIYSCLTVSLGKAPTTMPSTVYLQNHLAGPDNRFLVFSSCLYSSDMKPRKPSSQKAKKERNLSSIQVVCS